jgi:hypothetical protein
MGYVSVNPNGPPREEQLRYILAFYLMDTIYFLDNPELNEKLDKGREGKPALPNPPDAAG